MSETTFTTQVQDELAAALVILADHGIPPDVQELLVYGGSGVKPRGLSVVIEAARDEARQAKNAAYRERNQLVAALARLFPSGLKATAIEGWDPAWHGCVYIDLPTGQASWHYHVSEAHLFAGLPPYEGEWDGHSTEEKYERLAWLSTLRHRLEARGGVSEGAVEAGLAGGVKAFDSASDDTTMEDFRRQFVKAILEAAAPLMCGAGWKPISGAPKEPEDGKLSPPEILLWPGPFGRAATGYWNDDRYAKKPRPHWMFIGAGSELSRAVTPTHWDHLPAAPAPEEG